MAAIVDAAERGINWVDTAAVYGLGHSEEVVRRAVAALPADRRPLVFTKCGLVWDAADPMTPSKRVMAPASVRREVDASLSRLGVDRIDLYQVHRPPEDGTPIEEYWGVMAELRDAGKVGALGLSNHDVEMLDRAEKVAHVDAIQPHFSMVTRDTAAELAWAEAHGTGAIVYSPMQSGLLTGAFSAERVAGLADDDWRKRSPDFTTGLPAILALVDALVPIARAPRRAGGVDRRGLDAGLARRDRGHRGGPAAQPGRRLAAGGRPHAHARGPGRDRGRHRGDRGR